MKSHSPKSLSKLLATLGLLLLSPLVLCAQPGAPATKALTADQLAGNYKGAAKDPAGVIASRAGREYGKSGAGARKTALAGSCFDRLSPYVRFGEMR